MEIILNHLSLSEIGPKQLLKVSKKRSMLGCSEPKNKHINNPSFQNFLRRNIHLIGFQSILDLLLVDDV